MVSLDTNTFICGLIWSWHTKDQLLGLYVVEGINILGINIFQCTDKTRIKETNKA